VSEAAAVSSQIARLFGLSGKTAIVTAAGQGMGRGIARRLAEAGANIVVSHRHFEAAEEVAGELQALGVRAIPAIADVTDLDALDRTVDTALKEFGAIDILVNNAGGMHPFTPFLEVTPETWLATTERNMKGSYFLTQKVARAMIDGGKGGKIVNIASTAAFKPDFQLAAYNAAKAGVVSLARSLCAELAPHGILINTVVPGPIRTTATEAIYDDPGIAEMVRQRVPLGRPGTPEDIGNAVLFCASAASNHMTGSMIVIDGGFMWS
jgi:NAD(P)-dependent dehydrogenase (short-subunit alcohol dehydrogenase family)